MQQTKPWARASVEVLDVNQGPAHVAGGLTAKASSSVGTKRGKQQKTNL